MSPLVEFPLAAGGTVLVQVVSPDPPEGVTRHPDTDMGVTRGRLRDYADEVTWRATQTLDAALAAVRPTAETLLSTLTALSRTPDEVTVEFAVELSAEAGAFIATLGSAAHFKIALAWHPPQSESS